MNLELQRDKPLFESSLDVCIQAAAHTDAKTTPLTFRILDGTRQQQTSSQHERIFHFELTDPTEPFFLFILDIGEFDFHHLKRDQSIIVDFLAFPAKLMTLLKTCLAVGIDQKQQPQHSTFTTTLDANSGIFSVVESNEFKNLTHISLQLRPANDAALKSYLAARLQMALEDSHNLRTQLCNAGEVNDSASNSILQLNNALAEMRSRLDHEVITLQAAHANEVSGLKVSYSDTLNAAKSEYENKLASVREHSEVAIEDLREELFALKEKYDASEKQRSTAEYRCRELDRDLTMIGAERDRADVSAKQYSSALGDRDASILQLERQVASLTSKLEASRQQLKDKEEIITHAMGEKAAAEAARREAIERTELYSSAVEAMQEKLITANGEMQRGNQMIKGQLKEIDDLREKVRVKNEVIRKQEAVVTDSRAQISELSSRMQNEISAKITEQQRVDLLTKEVEAGKEKIASSLEALERNKEIMNHLNEMITQLQMGGGGSGATPSWSTPAAGNAGRTGGGDNGYNKLYGFRVVSGGAAGSPDGPADLYSGLSPEDANIASTGAVSKEFNSTGNDMNRWMANKAVSDSFSTRKYDSLIYDRTGNVTPASTSASRYGAEKDGYYRGLPVGGSSLTPSIKGDSNMFLHHASNSSVVVPKSSSANSVKSDSSMNRPKYHWQADDFGINDDVEVV